MALFELLELVILVALVTAAIWAIGRGGLEMSDVFRTLFTNRPVQGGPPGVQEDDDAWEHIHGRDAPRGRDAASGPDLVDAAPPVRTVNVRRSH